MTLGSAARIRLAVLLWRRGVWDALQLQRCVVYFVLDNSGQVLAQTTKCVVTNGLVYLGSLVLFQRCTQPATDWLLHRYAEPAYGPAGVAAWQRLLAAVFQLLWLLPVYLISLMVSCIWYQQIAVAACEVQHQQQLQKGPAAAAAVPGSAGRSLQQPQHLQPGTGNTVAAAAAASIPAPAPDIPGRQLAQQQAPAVALSGGPPGGPSASTAATGASGGGGMMQVLEGTAQEVFRVLLFVVFTLEVYVMGLIPVAGVVLNILFLSWLYAYYCFDYKWAFEGIRLPQRLQFFEANWAYFAGFGFPCVAATMFWPFHVGAALANLLFAVFIMVACGADPLEAQRSVLSGEVVSAPAGSLPIFKLALRPTYWLIRKVFGRRDSSKGIGRGAKDQ